MSHIPQSQDACDSEKTFWLSALRTAGPGGSEASSMPRSDSSTGRMVMVLMNSKLKWTLLILGSRVPTQPAQGFSNVEGGKDS